VPKNKRICQGSQKLSDGKRKGSGNSKNGNKYLSWAFAPEQGEPQDL
jgi:hypothetical protein